MTTLELKAAGNQAFSRGDFTAAIENYSKAIFSVDKANLKNDSPISETLATVLSNRAACHLRICQIASNSEQSARACVKDCTDALEIRPQTLKALYRRAQAHMILKDAAPAVRDLSLLIHLDPKNADAMALLRQAKNSAVRDHVGISEPQRLLRLLQTSLDASEEADKVDALLRALLGLCTEESSHAKEFTRHGGIKLVCKVGAQRGKEHARGRAILSTVVTLLCSICNNASVAVDWVSLELPETSIPVGEERAEEEVVELLHKDGKLSLEKLCELVDPSFWGVETSQAALTGIMRILKAQPLAKESAGVPAVDKTPLPDGASRVQELSDEEDQVPPLPPQSELVSEPFLSSELARHVLRACVRALHCKNTELLSLACDALVALWSEVGDYFTPETIVDSRMESLESRKNRMRRVGVLRRRAKRNVALALEENALPALVFVLNSNDALERARALACFGRLITTVEDDAVPRKKDSPEPEEDLLLKAHIKEFLTASDAESVSMPPLEKIKSRATVTSALMTAKPELGIWALQQPNGMRHVMHLISTGDIRCQDVAAEVLCLAASADAGQELLATALQSGAIHGLLQSTHAGIRAAAASTITKLSIRAKALNEDSPEVSAVMNAALDVLRSYKENTSITPAPVSTSTISSNSVQSVTRGVQPLNTDLDTSIRTASSVASAERAVEVVAAMAGRSHVKEELVHGSFRVASAIQLLATLELDARSTAGYGLAHIFAALTVTNTELHAIALAEKDMTPEQYEQLKELQRIKGTKDENGNPIEERKEAADSDTDAFCRGRIKRIVQVGGFVCLLRLLTYGSTQTQDAAARALRQMCVEESVRGLFIQQGALKACCDITTSIDSDSQSTGSIPSAVAKREAAHAVAKALITTNPSLLQGHARLGTIQPLIVLARDVDSSNLQQFEALLALTNLVSLGESEQAKFVREKGVSCVHYLMFSDHLMVRRAACEVFCNCSSQESLLRLLRNPEKVRLWVGLCEDWAGEENPAESFLIARACSGTLAGASQDAEVSAALIKEDVGSAMTALLESGNMELIHRALVIVEALIENGGKDASLNLLESGVVVGISKAHKVIQGTPNLVSLAQEIAQTLSATIKS